MKQWFETQETLGAFSKQNRAHRIKAKFIGGDELNLISFYIQNINMLHFTGVREELREANKLI